MFIWFSLAAFLTPIAAEFELSGTEAGVVVGAVPLVYIPLALVTGLVVDRMGPGRTLAIGVVLYGLAQIVRSFAVDFTTLLLPTIVIGVGATAVTFGLPKLVADLFPAHRTGPPSSIYLLGAAAGSASVFAFARPVLEPALGGWRSVFLASGVVAVGYGLVWLVIVLVVGIDRSTAESRSAFTFGAITGDLRQVLGHRELQLLVLIGTMYLFLTHGVQGWLPTMLEARGIHPTLAGQTTSAFVVAMASGTLVLPAVADRFERRRTVLIGCGGAISIGMGLVILAEWWLLLLAAILATGIGVGGVSPLLRAIPPALDDVGPRLTGTAVAFVFAVGEIGGFLGPFSIGALHDLTGSYLPGLALLTLAGLVIIAASRAMRDIQ